MIRNYFKMALRNLLKHKFISFINLSGLTIGITCCLLIAGYIVFEMSYDRYHKDASRIYRVTRQFNSPEGKVWLHLGTISPPFGPILKTSFPEIEKMTRILQFGTVPMRYGEKNFNEKDAFVADDQLFDMFSIKVKKGNPATALSEPFCVMLSEEKARKYFGNEDPINKTIRISNQYDLKVTGIYEAFPSNTHMHPGLLISFPTLNDSAVYGEENLRTNWGNNSFFTYIRLPAAYDYRKMEARFPAFLDEHFPRGHNASMKPSQTTALFLQKLTDIHLRSHLDYEAEENGDIKRVYIFGAIGLLILLIACINYMNLSTARAALRAREIGIRKVVGALRKEIMIQFLVESVMFTCIALLLSLGLVWLLFPMLNSLTGQHLGINLFANWPSLVGLALIPLLVGTLSGIYPAIFLSSFKPVKVLKGLFKMQTRFSFRQVLVVFQFAVSIILIICTGVVYNQLRYMQSKSLGYERDHVLVLPYYNALNDRYDAFLNELKTNAHVINAGRSSRIPTGRLLDADNASVPAGDSMQPVKADIKMVSIDYDFIPAYNIKMAAGRNYSRDYGTDTVNFIINEAAVTAIGWKSPEDAIGKVFKYSNITGKIIGVAANFNFESLHEKIVPLVFLPPNPRNSFYNSISLKIPGASMAASLAQIEATWKKFLPETPYEYSFLDERYNQLYSAENRQGILFSTFSCLAIFIACLGLFGLSAFIISQRIKEVGIRKVLGASVTGIVNILSKDFMKLVLIAALIAFPVAWYAMNQWLDGFAYRSSIAWWIFVLALLLASLIALVTISIQAIKAATRNPVKALRSE